MSFDSRKTQTGQEIVEVIKIYADGCKYATPTMLAARFVTLDAATSIPASGTGTVLTIATGDASLFYVDSYLLLPGGEVVGVSVDTGTQLTITSRAQFGTTAEAGSGALVCKLMHEGEADGTCFGYPQSCSSFDSWDGVTTRVIQFATAPLEAGQIYTNGLRKGSIRREGPEVHSGRDIGTRARLTFSIDDEVDELDQLNPYRDRIVTTGTKLGKMLARHPYFTSRKVEFLEGLRDAGQFEAPEYQTRGYIIDKLDLSRGQLSCAALDPLILSENKKAKMPPPSEGKLNVVIDNATTSFTYVNAEDYHYGDDAETVFVRIDSEVIKCTVTGVKTLTVVARGYRSASKDHSPGATIQICEVFENIHVVDAITRILRTRTTTPLDFIDDYSAVKALIPSKVISEAIIPKSISSVDALNQLIQIGELVFYFDEITQKIVIQYYPELDIQPVSLNDSDHFKKETIDLKRNEQEQYTRFTYSWAPYDVTKDSDEYFEVVHTVINGTLEGGRYMSAPNEMKSEKTLFLTNSTDDSLLGVSYVSRVIERNAELPMILTVGLDAETIGATQNGDVSPGKILSIATRGRQGTTGEQKSDLYQIERITGTLASGYKLKARKYNSIAPSVVDFLIDENKTNYDLSTEFAPATAGQYVVYISPEIVIGSTSTAIPAFTTGAQAAGVTFKIILRGQVLGQGGVGGAAGNASIQSPASFSYRGVSGSAGLAGGDAFNATVDCDIDCGSGVIWSGGGGQGGGSSSGQFENINYFSLAAPGDGGGGGQGFAVSKGGVRGSVADVTEFLVTEYGQSGDSGNQASFSGGGWGKAGPASTRNWLYEPGRAAGGAAGIAIKTNGNSVSIIAGNNPTNIKGPIA